MRVEDGKVGTVDDDGQSILSRFLPPIDEESGWLDRKKVQQPEDEYWGLFAYDLPEVSEWQRRQNSDDKEDTEDEKEVYEQLINAEGYIGFFDAYEMSLVCISHSKTSLLASCRPQAGFHHFVARLPVWKPPHLPETVCDSLRCWVRRSRARSEVCLLRMPRSQDLDQCTSGEFLSRHVITLDMDVVDWMCNYPNPYEHSSPSKRLDDALSKDIEMVASD